MKFRLMSDLHLEFHRSVTDFRPLELPTDKETVLLLAGDVATGIGAKSFLGIVAAQFYKVVYILGNHEFYNNEYYDVRSQWARMPLPPNVHVLDDAVIAFDGVRVIGSTLWTDFYNKDWWSMQAAKKGMNDYDICSINKGGKMVRLSPNDTVAAHDEAIAFIRKTLQAPFEGKTVVMTHHLPHPLCVHEQYKGHPLNPAYMTNLDQLIRENDIAVWCHGHTHDNVNIEVHNTKILCNPRGYFPHNLNKGFDGGLTFEV